MVGRGGCFYINEIFFVGFSFILCLYEEYSGCVGFEFGVLVLASNGEIFSIFLVCLRDLLSFFLVSICGVGCFYGLIRFSIDFF